MNSVTSGGPGLVAVGWANGSGAVWTSVDGLEWDRVPDNQGTFGGATMISITAGGPGLVAVGEGGSSAAVWTSVDGLTWVRDSDEGSVFGAGSLLAVAVAGPGLVAVGDVAGDRDLRQYSTAAIWTAPIGQ